MSHITAENVIRFSWKVKFTKWIICKYLLLYYITCNSLPVSEHHIIISVRHPQPRRPWFGYRYSAAFFSRRGKGILPPVKTAWLNGSKYITLGMFQVCITNCGWMFLYPSLPEPRKELLKQKPCTALPAGLKSIFPPVLAANSNSA